MSALECDLSYCNLFDKQTYIFKGGSHESGCSQVFHKLIDPLGHVMGYGSGGD